MKTTSVVAICACVLFSTVSSAQATHMTLSDEGLLTLDSNLQWYFIPTRTAHIEATRDVPGPGVEFDIHFIDTQTSPHRSIFWMSDDRLGNGMLAGRDISAFDRYDLNFTLLAVDGVSSPGTGGVAQVGAVIGDTGFAFAPMHVTLDPGAGYGVTATSSTSIGFGAIGRVGFYVWLRSGWDPGSATITILIEPAPGAVAIPEPASLALMTLGGTVVFGRCVARKRIAK